MARFIALLLLTVAACARPSTPDITYKQFAKAVTDRDPETAWSLLSKDSQGWLEGRAKAVADTAPGVVPADAKHLMFGNAIAGAKPVKSVVVLRESPDTAVVKVEVDGATPQEVQLVREGGFWKVQIPKR
jgi:hypothetical protein